MASLRNRQKQDRRRAIMDAAQTLFARNGYGATTVEDIAAAAGVSHVTVHNYYGTKAGVLLAMVAQSDAQLLDRLAAALPAQADALTLTVAFARQIMLHADQGLGRATWRQVLAAVAAEAGSAAAAEYAALDGALVQALAQRLDAASAAAALFDLINARFQRFVTSDQSVDAACDALRRDLSALLSLT
ncbi:TetR/AcrR family transcriptional regulator [Citreicella sp. C3M06]|uniref:TetR/AcrR family transcriptional regulator n=1 Tax=Citreicella sp. C3M06 TaxID=2841564 RepID=UPI001C0900C2|nr:TetR/AcrR family transcriptional regulator [Citreicella sp. C3M06]MBU2960175.1 TetR/AcrR family transcriptional regulator [Citreicella sp. C3M06]